MYSDIAHGRAQTLLKQRNLFALLASALGLTTVIATSVAVTRDREIVLTPTVTRPLVISSDSVGTDYLELVTRDTALTLLNRSPEGLDYWMEQILALAHPSAFGALKAQLVGIVNEQRGSDVSQSFVIKAMTVDPEALTSEVRGTLKTFVGAQVIASEDRRFTFTWVHSGLRLALTGFAQLPLEDQSKKDPS